MHHSCVRHLGGTVVSGSSASGTRYASRIICKAHSRCWMELCVFDRFPDVVSLSGTYLQQRNDLLASTRGAGPTATDVIRLEFQLFDDESPMTCENFRRLCRGDGILRRSESYYFQGVTPSYRGTFFHKIIPDFAAQGGDITMRVHPPGANYFNSRGRGWFADENKKRRHNEVGLLSMANNGPNTNGTQFFITTSEKQEQALNGRHVCFGRVTRGLAAFLKEVGPYGNVEGHPSRYVVVVNCGEGALPDDSEGFDLSMYQSVSHPLPHLPQSVDWQAIASSARSNATVTAATSGHAPLPSTLEMEPQELLVAIQKESLQGEVGQAAEEPLVAPSVDIAEEAHADTVHRTAGDAAEGEDPPAKAEAALQSSLLHPEHRKKMKHVTIRE